MHTEKCSTSLVIREVKIKTAMGYYFTPTGMARIKNSDNNKGWSGCGEIRTLGLHQRREMLQQLWETIWRSLQWLNTELPYDSAILLLGAHPREMNTCARATTVQQPRPKVYSSAVHNSRKVATIQMSIT